MGTNLMYSHFGVVLLDNLSGILYNDVFIGICGTGG